MWAMVIPNVKSVNVAVRRRESLLGFTLQLKEEANVSMITTIKRNTGTGLYISKCICTRASCVFGEDI